MPLHHEVKALLERMAAEDPRPRSQLTIAETRERYLAMRTLAGEPREMAGVEDYTVSLPDRRIRLRTYRPNSGAALPALVYFHGGRFISGDLETHDAVCRDLAARSGVAIVAVDYRLAPEHRLPAAVDDALAATDWVLERGEELGIDAERVGVGGDSAGGNLAAVVALGRRRHPGRSLKSQVLIYPMLDVTCTSDSHRTFASGFGPGSADMQRGYREYLPDGVDRDDPRVSPLLAPDVEGLPATMILTAEYDCLRDEGEAYAARLREAGVPVTQTRYAGAIHGFFQMAGVLELARQALDEVADFLRTATRAPSPLV